VAKDEDLHQQADDGEHDETGADTSSQMPVRCDTSYPT
jgi:hypothetical protein